MVRITRFVDFVHHPKSKCVEKNNGLEVSHSSHLKTETDPVSKILCFLVI
jgi:hypothetical protein